MQVVFEETAIMFDEEAEILKISHDEELLSLTRKASHIPRLIPDGGRY